MKRFRWLSLFIVLLLILPIGYLHKEDISRGISWAALITKGLIGEQDRNLWDGVTSTFTRITSTGGTITLNKVGSEVDALMVYGGGVNYNSTTINSALTAIGTSNQVCLVLRPGSWVMNANVTTTSNIILKVMPGAIVTTTGYTLTSNGPFEAGLYRVFSGTGSVIFGLGAVQKVHPEWWYSGSGYWDSSLASALASIKSVGGVIFLTRNYSINTAPWTFENADKIVIDGIGWATCGIYQTGNFSAITIDGETGYFTIRNITVSAGVAGNKAIESSGHFVKIHNNKITFNANDCTAVYINGGWQTDIYDNMIYPSTGSLTGITGIELIEASQYCNIHRNIIASFKGKGIVAFVNSTNVSWQPYTINIQNNDIEGITGDGAMAIDIANCQSVLIEGTTSEDIGELGDTNPRYIRVGANQNIMPVRNITIRNNICQASGSESFKYITLDYVEGFKIQGNTLGGASDSFTRLSTTANTKTKTPGSIPFFVATPQAYIDLLPTPQSSPQSGSATYVAVTDAPTRYIPFGYAYGRLLIQYVAAASDTYSFKFGGDSTPIEVVDASGGAVTRTVEAEGVYDGSSIALGSLQAKSTGASNWTVIYAVLILY